MAADMKTLSIVIPVFNEKNTIHTLIKRVVAEPIEGYKKEIIIIDDGSTDGTKDELKKWTGKVILLRTTRNQGKGSAVREGLKKATGEIIIIQDADMEYSPSDYHVLLEPFSDSRVYVVFGSRFLGAHLSTMFVYSLGNKFVTFVTNLLYNTNITDMETGYKVFRRSVIEGIRLKSRRFDFEPEFTAKVLKAGYQIYEVPISYFGRKFEEGKKLTWRDGIAAVWTLLRYRFSD